MIFCGDFVFPYEKEQIDFEFSPEFLEEEKIINFESQIISAHEKGTFRKRRAGLFSTSSSIDILNQMNVVCAGLANNHISDFPFSIKRTANLLLENNIECIGAGKNLAESIKPFYFYEKGVRHAVLNFGWKVIGCKYATNDKEGVAPFRLKEIELSIQKVLKENNSQIKILLYTHHGFEFEEYPQPAHRQLFHYLIDNYECVKGIFSHHSHVVQVFEVYKERAIFYGLGNLFLPVMQYPNLDIRELQTNPKFFSGICVKYSLNIEDIQIIHLEFSNKRIKEVKVENLNKQNGLIDISLKKGEVVKSYTERFKKESKSKFLMPNYVSFNSKAEIFFKDKIIKLRHLLILTLNDLKIIKPYQSKR